MTAAVAVWRGNDPVARLQQLGHQVHRRHARRGDHATEPSLQRGERARTVHHPALADGSNWTDFDTFWHAFTRWQAGIFTYRRGGWIAAGAMLTMIVDTMIPEAFSETHNWAGLITVLGFLVSFSLTQLTG